MLLEYVSRKISRLRWINRDYEQNTPSLDSVWVCGTYGDGPRNELSVWSGNGHTNDTFQLQCHCETNINGDVMQITPIGNDNVLVCLSTGDVLMYDYNDFQLQLRSKLKIHDDCCTDAVLNPYTKTIVTCGDDAIIALIDMRTVSASKSKCLSQNSFQCIGLVSANEVICGTSSGHIKLIDTRTKTVSLTLPNIQSAVTCIKKNPSSNHLVSCANSMGLLSLWDMRNNDKQLMQLSAHNAMVSEIQYMPNEANILISSSFDGQIIRWDISPQCQLKSVASVMKSDGESPINSFDMNSLNEIIFASDNEVLYHSNL